jgi:hypothetical protein
MTMGALFLSLASLLATPDIRKLGDDCIVHASEIKRLEWRRNQGLWLWNTKGKVHVICAWTSPSPTEFALCQPYLQIIQDAQVRGRKLILTYPEHYDCRESFGGVDLFTPVVALAIE